MASELPRIAEYDLRVFKGTANEDASTEKGRRPARLLLAFLEDPLEKPATGRINN